jgi:hypothetical protein
MKIAMLVKNDGGLVMNKQVLLTSVFLCVLAAVGYSQDVLHGYRAGFYQGRAFNTTANASGKVAFELFDLDQKNGRVRAYFEATEGLMGEAWLNGNITSSGELVLSGDLAGFRMEIRGRLEANGSIKADYSLEGTSSQRGNFEVSFVKPLPANMAGDTGFRSSAVSKLIGAWETGGALPAQVNPITGMSTGISFVDAHRLQFFPNNSFKHLWSHRHCDGPLCCSEQGMLESGTFSLQGERLVLNITDGNLINTDSCNPKMNGQVPVKHRAETYNVSIGQDSQLCLQQGSKAAACYEKQ